MDVEDFADEDLFSYLIVGQDQNWLPIVRASAWPVI
jgi:hypothetical protein